MWLRPHIPAVTIRVPCSPPWIPAVLTALSASTSSGSQASPVLHQKRRPAAAMAEVRTSASPPTLVGSPPRAFAGLSGFPSLPPVSSYFPYDGQKPSTSDRKTIAMASRSPRTSGGHLGPGVLRPRHSFGSQDSWRQTRPHPQLPSLLLPSLSSFGHCNNAL